MTTADPISLAQAQRLAANADTILLRATRPADLETPIGAFLRLDDGGPAYLLESVEGGERLGRYSFLGVGPRRLLEVRDGLARIQTRPVTEPTYSPDLPIETVAATDPLDAIRAFVPRRRVQPTEGMPRFTGGAVGALAYDAISAFETTVPLPERDPVGVPTAAFIETDLVLVFDHLTHTLSAIASLHTDAPDLEGRYRIAEEAIFEALERSARPSAAEIGRVAARTRTEPVAGDRPQRQRARRASLGGPVGTSLGREEYIHAVEVAKDAIAAGEAIQVVLARRQSFDLPDDPATGATLDGIGLYRSLRRVNPSPYLFFVRTPDLRGRRRIAGAAPPGRGRQADHPPDRRHATARRQRPRGRAALRGAPARPQGAGRARDARRPRPQRPRPRRAGGDRDRQQVHGGRALQPRPPSRLARRGAAQARARRARRAALGLPGRHAVGRAQGPRDAAHRGRRGRASRAVRRRGRLPRLRRQPRHRDHHPERGPQGRPGARPHGRRDRRRVGPGTRVRGDRAQGGGPAPGDRDGGGRHARAPAPARLPSSKPTRSRSGHDPRHRQLRQLHVQPRPGAPGGRRRGPRRAQRRHRGRRGRRDGRRPGRGAARAS